MNIFKIKNTPFLLSIFALSFMAVIPSSQAQMFSSQIGKDMRVISGIVIEIRPETILLEDDDNIFTVRTHDLNVEDLDAQFLQIGDELSVLGFKGAGAFDAQGIVYVDVGPSI